MIDDIMRESETYRKILEHRKTCSKWGKEFCIDCFGGGLTIFSEKLINELKTDKAINHIKMFQEENKQMKKEFNFSNHNDFLPRIQQNVTKIRFIRYFFNLKKEDLTKND